MNLVQRSMLWACRRSWRIYRHANFVVSVDGTPIPIMSATGLRNLDYRVPAFLSVLRAGLTLRPGGWVVDVGANIGEFLLNLVQIDRDAPYLGFEPLLPAAAYVRRIIHEGNLPRHSILPIALGEHAGTGTLRFGSESDVSATLSTGTRPPGMYSNEQEVVISTGDRQLLTLPSIAFIKVDVEGFELDVLRGMTQTVERHRPPMLIEVMPYAYLVDGSFDRGYFGDLSREEAQRVGEARKDHAEALDRFLRDRDYRFFACPPSGAISPATTLVRGDSRDRDVDFLVLPGEGAESFLGAWPEG